MTLFWFRRDLRINDNAGLYHALKNNKKVQCIFIFDTDIINKLAKNDRRISILYDFVSNLNQQLNDLGSSLTVYHGNVEQVFQKIIEQDPIKAVYINHDYEPNAILRDQKVGRLLQTKNISFTSYKDQCIFEKDEIVKEDGKPYTVYTPYMKKWKSRLNEFYYKSYPNDKYFHHLNPSESTHMITLDNLGFTRVLYEISSNDIERLRISNYQETRDYPALPDGTSKISVHLRFGTISIRTLVRIGLEKNESWLNELIWRDFYMMILHHFPYVCQKSFKPKYDLIKWQLNESEFSKWCEGKTGYPLVDAGMRELNATGYMHNRVRMVVASFLTKHLLIDWRLGEKYFAEKLIDYDLSANNGGWQWAAGCGCDAAPYFRIFNPSEQAKKFDKANAYIKKWVPEYLSLEYKPMIDHSYARARCLKIYKNALEV